MILIDQLHPCLGSNGNIHVQGVGGEEKVFLCLMEIIFKGAFKYVMLTFGNRKKKSFEMLNFQKKGSFDY